MKNMNYTSDVEYETEEKKKFRLTRGSLILIVLGIVAVIAVIIILIINFNKPQEQEYTVQDFNSLEQRMVLEAPNYVMQKQIVLTENDTKINLKDLLVENGGPIDPSKQKAAQVCDGYVIARKESSEKYFAYIKCGDMFTTYGYESNNDKEKTTTTSSVKQDIEKPNIMLIGEKQITISLGEKFRDPGATATDNIDGDITANIKVSGNVNVNLAGSYNLIYSVSDKTGNKSEVKRIVNVVQKATTTKNIATTKNNTTKKTTTKTTKNTTRTTARPTAAPTITLYGSARITLYVGQVYNDPGYSATDSLGTTITSNVNVSGNVDTSREGTYYVTYTVADRYGNKAAASRTIVVKNQTVSIKGISISPNVIEMSKGETKTLTVFYTPSNVTDKSLSWTSSNSSVATVSNGVVTAKAKGTTTITAKSSNGKTASAKVTVK